MQRQRRILRLRSAVPQLLCQHGLRKLQVSSGALSKVENATEAATPSAGPTQLHSVVSISEGSNAFAAATVTFPQCVEDTLGTGAGAGVSTAQHAAQMALLALRGALGCQRPPSALVAFASLDLPRPAVQALADTLAEQLQGSDTPVIGCSSRLRLPDELRTSSGASSSSGSGGSSSAAAVSSPSLSSEAPSASAASAPPPPSPPLHHITLAAAHLPDHEVHAIRSETSSLPSLPHLAAALQGRRPPAFLLLAGGDSQAAELLARLQNLFPGSCIGAGVAAQQAARDRRLLLVNSGGGSGKSSSSGSSNLGSSSSGLGGGGAGTGAMAGDKDEAGMMAAALFNDVFGSSSSSSGGGGGGAMGRRSSGRPTSADFEGPFQRMLLGREDAPGTAAAAAAGNREADRKGADSNLQSSDPPSSSSSSSSAGRGGSGGGMSAFHRRRPQPASGTGTGSAAVAAAGNNSSGSGGSGGDSGDSLQASSPSSSSSSSSTSSSLPPSAPASAASSHPSTSVSVTSTASKDSKPQTATPPSSPASSSPSSSSAAAVSATQDADEAAAEAFAASLRSLQPPFVLVGGEVYGSGCAMLAIYPKAVAAAAAEAATATTAAAAAATTSGIASAGVGAVVGVGRLPGVACDRLARIVLGTDHLHHVALRGAALAAISPPPTGPEPAPALPPAPDNPYYWLPAAVGPSHLAADPPHVERQQQQQQQLAAASPSPCEPGAEAEAVAAAADGDAEIEAKVEAEVEAEEVVPSAAVLAALSEGLVGLPLFPLEGTILFPGQTIQLRVFEKRYRLLLRACLEQGAAFGLCGRGTGCTAVVRSYQCASSAAGGGAAGAGGAEEVSGGDVMVLLEGGVRFSYGAEELGVMPASYGLNVAKRAEYLLDEPPASEEDGVALLAAAYAIIDGVAGALEAATSPPAQQAARTFASALHFASSLQPAATTTTPSTSEATIPSTSSSTPSTTTSSSAEEDAALLAADVAEAKRGLDPDTASLLSLYLAPHIPVHLESLRREWFTSRSALWRLQQEASWLRNNPRVCMAVASSVLRLPREHPLRVMLGLTRVAATS